jgi:hypothetical protein
MALAIDVALGVSTKGMLVFVQMDKPVASACVYAHVRVWGVCVYAHVRIWCARAPPEPHL